MSNPANSVIYGTLKRCGLFRDLSENSLTLLAGISVIRRFSKGETVFLQGAVCPGIFVVGDGLVKVAKYAPGGKEHVLHWAYPGMTFAEVAAIGRFACPASAEAVEDTIVALIVQDRLHQILESDHNLSRQLLINFAQWVRHFVGLLEDIVLRDATGRIARHLLQMAGKTSEDVFTLPVLKKDLASHLNLTSETLSRTFRRLAEEGLIELLDQQQIRIINTAALRDIGDGLPPGEFD